MVRALIASRVGALRSAMLIDVGCGTGNLYSFVSDLVAEYEGVDVVHYEGYPRNLSFHQLDLDSGKAKLPDGYADFVVAVETIEHLENPRAFIRELVRLCKPDGWVIVTTPNQLSVLSKLTLIVKNQFNAFTESSYPAHITALLETDLRRIAHESGLKQIESCFTCYGRFPGTAFHWPRMISRIARRALSDNIGIIGKRS